MTDEFRIQRISFQNRRGSWTLQIWTTKPRSKFNIEHGIVSYMYAAMALGKAVQQASETEQSKWVTTDEWQTTLDAITNDMKHSRILLRSWFWKGLERGAVYKGGSGGNRIFRYPDPEKARRIEEKLLPRLFLTESAGRAVVRLDGIHFNTAVHSLGSLTGNKIQIFEDSGAKIAHRPDASSQRVAKKLHPRSKQRRDQGLVLLFDVTRRQFFSAGHVVESWTRKFRNVSLKRTADTLDVPMFWDIPLDQIHPVAIHISKENENGRLKMKRRMCDISRDHPEYTERLYENRKFYGCIIPVPLGLEPGESMFLKLLYRHVVSTPTDDQIIRSMPGLLRLIWEGNANDGLKFVPQRSFVEARYPDPTSATRPRETERATRYLRFEEADTRMVLDLPRPRPGYHYRVVFTLEKAEKSVHSGSTRMKRVLHSRKMRRVIPES